MALLRNGDAKWAQRNNPKGTKQYGQGEGEVVVSGGGGGGGGGHIPFAFLFTKSYLYLPPMVG